MSEIYKVFTIESGKVAEGAVVGKFSLKGAGVSIDAILVGEEGRGRSLGVLPVSNAPKVSCPDQGKKVFLPGSADSRTCPKCGVVMPQGETEPGKTTHYVHPNEGEYEGRLLYAKIGQTRSGRPKLTGVENPGEVAAEAIVVFRTHIGFRGGNSHTGDRAGVEETTDPWGRPKTKISFSPFPGQILVEGMIAQGAAGSMGSGQQMVALMPAGVVFRTGYSGRLYGAPKAHYYVLEDGKLIAATMQERELADLF